LESQTTFNAESLLIPYWESDAAPDLRLPVTPAGWQIIFRNFGTQPAAKKVKSQGRPALADWRPDSCTRALIKGKHSMN